MFEITSPAEIEKRSFEIITEELGERRLDPECADVIKRVIHTTADFDYAENLVFSEKAVEKALAALKKGCTIVTDTQMAKAGISRPSCEKLGVETRCFMSDPDVAEEAKKRGVTRATVSMERAADINGDVIFAVGNAPTALIELKRLIDAGKMTPALIIGVPVGFVNVVESKEEIMKAGAPFIVARGRKGGSTVAAAICNALLYKLTR